jgi:cytochrome c oxidase assembly protein subunit 15
LHRIVNRDDSMADSGDNVWLARFAKLVVALTFLLIFVGGHTTTAGAGMAFPDWPLSHGSLNPRGWLTDTMMFLEHSHRLTAGTVAAMISVLFIWVWRRRESVPAGTVALAFWALIGVLSQALLGGLRVVLDPQGIAPTTSAIATTFRILHGCFAQLELCLVVALATMLSPVWRELPSRPELRGVAQLGWIALGFVALQLVVGATMRHLGAGLAIPTWPRATPDGGWLPVVHNVFIDLNFTHTRVGAILVTIFIAWLTTRVRRLAAGEPRFLRAAFLLDFLLVAQIALGVSVIWNARPPMLTTLHVLNGAAILGTILLITLRAARASHGGKNTVASLPIQQLAEVAR